jgi:DNA-binding NarL/FixJ family response regulator
VPQSASVSARPAVLIVDDHALFAECLALVLRMQGFERVDILTEDLGPERILAAAENLKPELVLLDLYLGKGGVGTGLIAPLKAVPTTVLVLSATEDRRLLAECLEEGADGLFDKARSFEQLVDDLEEAAVGRSVLVAEARTVLLDELRERRRAEHAHRRLLEELTAREGEILSELMEGRSTEQIADEGGVAPSTVRTQIKSILRKLGVNSQLAAVAFAHSAGWQAAGRTPSGG